AKDNVLFDGTVLLTGTCIVPPNQFTLAAGDRIEIEITGIGTLVNTAIAAS
ncbi:fumarylacetoacetate hydrolase family protein, partial [Paenibacillus sepulcri]|nr:fumarylacetoacetate hydrolase family protein [Paenibacillus sepulcri]